MAFKLALVQMLGNALQPERLARLKERVAEAAAKGAQVVVLPELVLHDYFCIEEEQRHFDLAHPVDDETMNGFGALAAKHKVVLVVPFFEKRAAGVYHNSAAVYDADGKRLGVYRKMHIPDDPGFYEKYYFTPGDAGSAAQAAGGAGPNGPAGFMSFATKYGRIGVLICWDQWFPEGARLTAMQGCDLLVYPTAIGWDDKETAHLGHGAAALDEKWLDAWVTMQRSHAIANGVYVAAVNRVGREGHLRFWGNSFVSDPGGGVIARLGDSEEETLYADIDAREVENHRRVWPFLRDRRIDSYQDLLRRFSR